MIIQLQFSEIMGYANLFQRFLTLAVYCVSTPSILLTQRDLACAQMKFHKHMPDLYVLKRISSSMLHFSSIIFFIRSVFFFILIFIENPVKTLFVVEAYFQYDVS
jgi:hypothetical protein